MTGQYSGYSASELSGITVDYVTEQPFIPPQPSLPAMEASGDLDGNFPNPIVVKIQGRAIAATAPTDGQVLTWEDASSSWKPGAGGGGSFTAGGDLAGNSTSQQVISLTGTGGFVTVAAASPTLRWASAAVTPTLTQADETANSVNGDNFVIKAQSSTGTTTNGGNVLLIPGSGTTAAGSVRMYDGGTGNNAIEFTTRSAGASSIAFVSTVTNATITQSSTSTTNGSTLQFSAQASSFAGATGGILGLSAGSATGGTGTGGAVNVSSGTGPTANGSINFRTGSTTFFTFLSPNPTGTVNAQFVNSITAVNILQANNTTNSATGAALTVQAQNATGTTAIGGNLNLTSGTGTSNPGSVRFNIGATLAGYFDGAITTGGNIPLRVGSSGNTAVTIFGGSNPSNATVFYGAGASSFLTLVSTGCLPDEGCDKLVEYINNRYNLFL